MTLKAPDCPLPLLSFYLSILSEVTTLPNLDLRLMTAAISNRVLSCLDSQGAEAEDCLISLWTFCAAHCPKESGLASFLLDVSILMLPRMTKRLFYHFCRIAIVPLALVLSSREWRIFFLRLSSRRPPGCVACALLLRHLTALTVLARYEGSTTNTLAQTRHEMAAVHLLPVAWHGGLRRVSATVEGFGSSGGTRVLAQTDMARHARVALQCVSCEFPLILSEFIGEALLDQANIGLIGPLAMLMVQVLKLSDGPQILQDILSGRPMPLLCHGWLLLQGMRSAKDHDQTREDLLRSALSCENAKWRDQAHVFCAVTLRLGRNAALKNLYTLLQSAALVQPFSREKLKVLAALQSLMIVNPLLIASMEKAEEGEVEHTSAKQGQTTQSNSNADGRKKGCLADEKLLDSATKPVQCHRWDFLFTTRDGTDFLVSFPEVNALADPFFVLDTASETLVVERCPFWRSLSDWLDLLVHPMGAEPLDKSISSADEGQTAYLAERRLWKNLRLESLEVRTLKSVSYGGLSNGIVRLGRPKIGDGKSLYELAVSSLGTSARLGSSMVAECHSRLKEL